MTAIWKREFRSYLNTVIGWLFMAVNLFFVGLYFTVYNLLYGSAYFATAISAAGIIAIISVPILTMKVLAEERKAKTDQLLFTAPVPLGKIIAGKFLALASIYTIPMLVICFYPLIMSAFGSVPMGEAYTAILGFYLYGLACIAVGIFISSLTENQVIAAVLSFAVLFLCYIMEGLCSIISSEGNILTTILGCFDFYSRFYAFLNGTLDLRAALYFISVIVLLLFLTCQVIQKRRWSVSAAGLKTGVYSSSLVIVACAVTVFVNLAASQLPDSVTAIDVTKNQLYSLTDDTLKFLDTIDEDITIYVYGTKSGMDETVAQTLSRYESSSSHIKVEYRDPVKYPNFAATYTTDSVAENSLIVVAGEKSKVIAYSDMYETEFDYTTYSSSVTGYDAEGCITSALDYVTSENTPVLYNITGHDELSLDDSFSSAVSKANIDLQTINLMDYDSVPEDADIVLINAPTSDFSSDDAQKIKDYMAAGGKAIVITGYTDQDMTNFKSILSEYGVTLYDGIVAENSTSNYYQTPFYLLPNVEYSDYTEGIRGSKYIFAPYALGMRVAAEDDTLTVTDILTTSEQAVTKNDLENMTSYSAEDGDETGTFEVGVQVTKTEDSGTSQLFVFTSENLFTDSANQMVSGANLQLFTNVTGSLIDTEVTVSIPVKEVSQETLTVAQNYFLMIGLLTTLVLPITLLVVGIVIWVRRRRR